VVQVHSNENASLIVQHFLQCVPAFSCCVQTWVSYTSKDFKETCQICCNLAHVFHQISYLTMGISPTTMIAKYFESCEDLSKLSFNQSSDNNAQISGISPSVPLLNALITP